MESFSKINVKQEVWGIPLVTFEDKGEGSPV